MKNNLKAIALAGFLSLGASNLLGIETTRESAFRIALASVPVSELPRQAAALVKRAPASDRQTTTANVVKAALNVAPDAASAIVSAIGLNTPDMAPVAAGTVCQLQPNKDALVARAAAEAAPNMSGRIIEAVCQAVPANYRNIAVAVSRAAPDSGKEILDAVSAVVPDMKSSIHLALLAYGGNASAVADVLDMAKSIPKTTATTISSAASPPPSSTVTFAGPPWIPLSATPASTPPDNSGEVPAGNRVDAAP